MFLQASVILLTGGLPQCMLGYHPPPRSRPPQSRHPPPPGSRPPRPGTPREQTPPWEQTPLGADPPGPGTPSPREQTPPGTEHAGRYGQRAGGMHPTGMQSCFVSISMSHLQVTYM